MKNEVKYPIYVISKGRYDCCYTADFLVKDKVPFKLVIEKQELDLYLKKYDIKDLELEIEELEIKVKELDVNHNQLLNV